MDKLRIKFEVMACGSTSFHSNKTNKDYQRMRLMGFAIDEFGGRVPCTADLAFDVSVQQPKQGDTVVLTLDAISTRGAMCELTFSAIDVAPTSSRELKQK